MDINIRTKLKLASKILIINTLSNDVLLQLNDLFCIKTIDRNDKKENINQLINYLKTQNNKEIDEFLFILKQIPNINNKKINNDRNEKEKLLGDNNKNEIKEYKKSEQVEEKLLNITGNNSLKPKKRTYNEMIATSKKFANEIETNINDNKSENNEIGIENI